MEKEDDKILSQSFKEGMRLLSSGVSVISTLNDNNPSGLLVTSVTSVTSDPPTLLVCINNSATSCNEIDESNIFAVNILPKDEKQLAEAFSSPKNRESRFKLNTWTALKTGAPILDNALVSFDCVVKKKINYSTHTIFFGEIVDVKVARENLNPLLYFNQKFCCQTSI